MDRRERLIRISRDVVIAYLHREMQIFPYEEQSYYCGRFQERAD